jgi:hypothetical protein
VEHYIRRYDKLALKISLHSRVVNPYQKATYLLHHYKNNMKPLTPSGVVSLKRLNKSAKNSKMAKNLFRLPFKKLIYD